MLRLRSKYSCKTGHCGNPVPAVFGSKGQASALIDGRIVGGAASWENLHERFEVKRTDHQEACSLDGACANGTERFFRRQRRAEIGIHAHIAGAEHFRYAKEG